MTYRPKDRKITPLLISQIAKQEERIEAAGYWAICSHIGCFSEDFKLKGTFYSKKFKH